MHIVVVIRNTKNREDRNTLEGGGYFGTIKGNGEYQNKITNEILCNMLDAATWINIHSFSGREYEKDGPILEIRVAEGYGARWTATNNNYWTKTTTATTIAGFSSSRNDNSDNNSNEGGSGDGVLQFRGFLEPQMEDGHEKKWRH